MSATITTYLKDRTVSTLSPLAFPVLLLKIYLFLNLYKALVGVLIGREILTALSIVISIGLMAYFLTIDFLNGRIRKTKLVSFLTFGLFTFHLLYSILILRASDVYPSLVSYFQISMPMVLLFVLDSLDKGALDNIARFLVRCLVPFMIFGLIEFLLPIDFRKALYMEFSFIVRGERAIDVAYYLGDTDYQGLRLGSLFFEPLTFAFVSAFLTIFLFSKRESVKGIYSLVINILSLGKLPIATTLISLASKFFKSVYRLYYTFIFVAIITGVIYLARNAEKIAVENPSMGSHMVGLYFGLKNGLENPILGHGFGTAGYLSYLYYDSKKEEGPFRGLNGKMNGNESAIGVITYQLGYVLLFLFMFFFISYFKRLIKGRQFLMASGIVGYMLSLFLSESVLSVTVVSVALIFSKSLMARSE
ncbi:MAG: hypothetical protein DI535_16930 [Citrobacter freundii]|nr:MAG: hypothetical protein DI535_16930 [Citrobacter freundii]